MIFVLDEPPKWHLERACFWLSTLFLKAQPESNYFLFRPPQNIKIIEKRQENKRKSNTWKSSKSTGPKTLQNIEIQLSANAIETNKNHTKATFWRLHHTKNINICKDQWQKSKSWHLWMRAFEEPREAQISTPLMPQHINICKDQWQKSKSWHLWMRAFAEPRWPRRNVFIVYYIRASVVPTGDETF